MEIQLGNTRITKFILKKSRYAIRSFEKRLANDKYHPKKLYEYVNRKLKNSDAIQALTDPAGQLCTDKDTISNILNQ